MNELYCPKEGCNTVLIPMEDNTYFCAGCNAEWHICIITTHSKDLKVCVTRLDER